MVAWPGSVVAMSPGRLRADLARAIDADEIEPYFQPLVELRTGRLSGFEVLARWRHPTQVVHPTDFIPLAERNHLIGPLTERLLRRAATAASGWPSDLSLSINISPVDLGDPKLPDRLGVALQESGFPFNRLVCEITEAVLIGDIALAREVVIELRALGVKLALDDFGIGYANLRQLLTLPFDRLKVDASFVCEMLTRHESRKVISSVIGLGHKLGMAMVAEGVESLDHANMLVNLGCDMGQGWLFGHPLPAAETNALLSRGGAWCPALMLGPHTVDPVRLLEAMPSESVGQLRALYNSGPVGLGLVDTGLRYQALNHRLAEIHGVPVAEHLGRTIAEMVPHLYSQIEPYLQRALNGETISSFEPRLRESGGKGGKHVMVASYQPIRDAADEVVGVSIAVIDMTQLDRDCGRDSADALIGSLRMPGLTARQSEVMRLLASGRSVKEIARALNLRGDTVKSHLTQIYRLLGARNRVEAVLRCGLVANIATLRDGDNDGPVS